MVGGGHWNGRNVNVIIISRKLLERFSTAPQYVSTFHTFTTFHLLRISQFLRMTDRIAKVIARSGLCSRRAAEKLLTQANVTHNGIPVTHPSYTLLATNDTHYASIHINGVPLEPPPAIRLWQYYKPLSVICTANDPENRPTVIDAFHNSTSVASNGSIGSDRVMPVGRLDINTEGLLLVTNNGELKRRLELPRSNMERVYMARVYSSLGGEVKQKALDTLLMGAEVDGVKYGPIVALKKAGVGGNPLEQQQEGGGGGKNAWVEVRLSEGKNREVRKALDSLGYKVNKLKRLSFGEFELGKMKSGEIREVERRVVEEFMCSATEYKVVLK